MNSMKQMWDEIKSANNGAILLFKMGDYYSAYYDDAIKLRGAYGRGSKQLYSVDSSEIKDFLMQAELNSFKIIIIQEKNNV